MRRRKVISVSTVLYKLRHRKFKKPLIYLGIFQFPDDEPEHWPGGDVAHIYFQTLRTIRF